MKNTFKNYAESTLYVVVTLGVYSMVGRLLYHILTNDAPQLMSSVSGFFSLLVVVGFMLFCVYATFCLIIADIKERHNA